MYEVVYSEALTAVAMGVPRDATREELHRIFPSAAADTITRAMADALTDVLKQGVECDDIDPSWL